MSIFSVAEVSTALPANLGHSLHSVTFLLSPVVTTAGSRDSITFTSFLHQIDH